MGAKRHYLRDGLEMSVLVGENSTVSECYSRDEHIQQRHVIALIRERADFLFSSQPGDYLRYDRDFRQADPAESKIPASNLYLKRRTHFVSRIGNFRHSVARRRKGRAE